MKRCPICVRAFPAQERFCSVHGIPLVEERIHVTGAAGELSGHVLDCRYRLAGVLGRGGMGVVYEAENLRIGRRCAVKVLHPSLMADAKARMRLFREVQAASRVRHPNVVEILDYGEDNHAGSYLVMEFIEGETLAKIITRDAPLPLEFIAKATVQICAALSATHAAGLIHRDLKPGNVVVQPGGVAKVLDFGLIKPFENDALEDFASITTEGMVFGTPMYMSPEQATGQNLDARTDIYSLGVLVYEMVVGEVPFSGSSYQEIIAGHCNENVPLPGALDPPVEVPAALDAILLKAMAKAPSGRHQSMARLMEDFYDLGEERGVDMSSLELAEYGRARTKELAAERDGRPSVSVHSSVLSSPLLLRLQVLGQEGREDLVDSVVAALQRSFPRYRSQNQELLRVQIAPIVDVGTELLTREPSEVVEAAGLNEVLKNQPADGLTLTEVIGAIFVSFSACRPLVQEAAEGDHAKYVQLQDEMDQALLPFVFLLVDGYVTGSQRRLLQLNELLSRRNEELQQLRSVLGERVKDASRRLAQAEALKVRVAETISCGVMLVERGTHRVLLFNPAMERLSGIPGSSVVGKSTEEIIHLAEGVPFEEFLEQMRLHGEVGLRKLRLSFTSGQSKTVYVRGQPFFSATGERVGTLFTVDDVTEREQIIESFARYLSRDVVDRVVRGSGSPEPGCEARRAAILSANIRGVQALFDNAESSDVVRLLSDYVRVVADAVLHNGGAIDRISAEGTVIYFARDDVCASAAAAAAELARRVAALNGQRADAGKVLIDVGIGLHVGDVMVLNVGGSKRMVQTVFGEAMGVAEALQAAALPGEILVSKELTKGTDVPLAVESAGRVALSGTSAGVDALRLSYDLDDLPEPEPITMRGPIPGGLLRR